MADEESNNSILSKQYIFYPQEAHKCLTKECQTILVALTMPHMSPWKIINQLAVYWTISATQHRLQTCTSFWRVKLWHTSERHFNLGSWFVAKIYGLLQENICGLVGIKSITLASSGRHLCTSCPFCWSCNSLCREGGSLLEGDMYLNFLRLNYMAVCRETYMDFFRVKSNNNGLLQEYICQTFKHFILLSPVFAHELLLWVCYYECKTLNNQCVCYSICPIDMM